MFSFENEDALVEHIVEHTLFFDREMVRDQARDLRALIRHRTGASGTIHLQRQLFSATCGQNHDTAF